jgi:tetratricopeptide (TPR) repeat protein
MAKLSTDQILLKANSHARKGQVNQARKLYTSVLSRFPKNKRARAGLAELEVEPQSRQSDQELAADLRRLVEQLKRGELDAVVNNAEILLKANTENEVLWNIYGSALGRLGERKQAERAFLRAVRLAPDFVSALKNLGANYEASNDLNAAIDAYQEALLVDPRSPDLLIRIGNTLKQQGNHKEALACFERVLATDPENILALKYLGILLRLRHDFSQAVACFDRVMDQSPSLSVLKNLSSVPLGYLSSELVEKSQKHLNSVDDANADLAGKMFVQANLDRHKGEIGKAFDSFCLANSEKLNTFKEGTLDLHEDERRLKLNFLRHWTPTPTSDIAQVTTLVILGPSRSGKTSLETMLRGSRFVESAYEKWRSKGRLREVAKMQLDPETPSLHTFVEAETNSPLGTLSLEDVFYTNEDTLIADGKYILTATNPTFINHVANLNDMLPGVCFCSVQRNPADIAAEIFTTNYRKRNVHSYDPPALLRYLEWYSEMSASIVGKVRGITLKFEDILTRPQHAISQIEALVDRDLEVCDLAPKELYPANPLTKLFEQRFM